MLNNSEEQKLIARYLHKYQWKEYAPECLVNGDIDTVVVVPAIEEFKNTQKLLLSLSRNHTEHLAHTLFLIVVNNSHAAPDEVKSDNHLLLNWLTEMHEPDVQKAFFGNGTVLNLGFINASSPGYDFPMDIAGVGLARKIGMDSALLLFNPDAAHKTIVCLDADCTVSQNYIATIRTVMQTGSIQAAVIQYEHLVAETAPEFRDAIVCYELFLRHYTLGLIYAGSLFAFHSIGSAMLCDVETYCKCEGMNKKKAGEDFYFLEKIAKQKNIHTINAARVFPSSRPSWRVPFGTGQRVNRFIDGQQDEYLVYSPESFEVLKQWLVLMKESSFACEVLMEKAGQISTALADFLAAQHFENFWRKAQKLPAKQFSAQTRFWFDGFRTLKLLHFLRDNGYPLQPMFQAIPVLLQNIVSGSTISSARGINQKSSTGEGAWQEHKFAPSATIPSFDVQCRLLEEVRNVSRNFAPDKID